MTNAQFEFVPVGDQELLANNTHIPTAEVEQDIADTEQEIASMKIEAEHLAATPLSLPSSRFAHMRAEARLTGIKKREAFVQKLHRLLRVRHEQAEQ